ncbi:MurR/RpiR family transcriptional regulator [Streptomyces sp. NPDC001508]|uniref:MurR/RpiR family transcriptional regulator n=1 Tax=Streptomyces sp. NPDC001508 TaxID=3154656 RepID=UPI00332C3E36
MTDDSDQEHRVSSRIRSRMSKLSASERKVARALLASYPAAGLDTVAVLAEKAAVSPPTVVRFAIKLGFSGFPDLQKSLLREVDEPLGSPLQQYPHGTAVPHAAADAARLVTETLNDLSVEDLQRASALLADPRKSVHVLGGRFSRALADYLYFHLLLLRRDVVWLGSDDLTTRNLVESSGKSDVLIAFDYRRYDDATVRAVKEMRRRGATIVLFTDRWLSPASEDAQVVLLARVECQGRFDSLVGAMAVADTLISAVAEALGETGLRHIKALDETRLPGGHPDH